MKNLGNILSPIKNEIGLDVWFEKIEIIANQLLNTYQGYPNEDRWSRIITRERFGSGRQEFKGWFMTEILNVDDVAILGDAPSGIVTVPITLKGDGYEEKSAIVAGMIGYKQCEENGKPLALEPVHGWGLFLEPTSRFRNDF